MNISWHGGSTVEISHRKQRAILNASDKKQLENAHLVVYGQTDEKNVGSEEGLLVDWPGEYDTSGFVFKGIEHHDNKGAMIAYTFQTPAGNVAWMGEIEEYPNEAFIESVGEVHVLIVPVGDKGVMKAKDAFRLVEALEPLVVIPICHGDKHDGLQAFLKEMDVPHPEAQKSFELKKSLFGEGQMDLVILEAV